MGQWEFDQICSSWSNRVIPFAVEIAAGDVDGGKLIIGDGDAFRIGGLIKTTAYGEAGIGARCGDKLDDDLVGEQGLASPVPGYEGEEPVLDPVPLGRARGQMTNDQSEAGLIGEPLEFGLPQPAAGAVATAAVGGDDQAGGAGVARLAHLLPPAADRVDGKGGRVVIDANAHPPAIRADVVDPVRDGLAQLRDQEIVGAHRFGLALRAPCPARVLEIPNQLLLLGVDRDRRLTLGQRRVDRLVDVLELGVAVGMVRSLTGLAVCLKAVTTSAQYPADAVVTDAMTQIPQGPGDLAKALDRPAKRLRGITALRRCDDPLQTLNQTRIAFSQRLAASPRPPHPTIRCRPGRYLVQTTANRAAGNPGDARHRSDPTPTGGQRLARRKTPPLPLVQIRAERLKPLSYRQFVDHESTYGTNRSSSTTIC